MAVDIGSSNITCLIAEVVEGSPKIIGSGISKSQGIRKGAIIHIEQAAQSIKSAIEDAKMMAGVEIKRAIISISGVYAKSRNASGVVTVPSGEIGVNEIRRSIHGALHNAMIPGEREVIHILPYQFIIDDQEYVDDPNGMSGSRLKTNVHIVTLPKTVLDNLRRVTKFIGIEIESIVLSSYATSIAVLNDDEKELGVACIDMGGSTCDVMIYSGSSMCYDEVLPVGSHNITNDIATVFNTPFDSAETLKIEYGDVAYQKRENQDIPPLKIPSIGSDDKKRVITLQELSKVILYRLAETLNFLYMMIERNELRPQIGAGVVFTGGLVKLKGTEEMIESIFQDYPIRIAFPKAIEGLDESLRDPSCSVAVGLIMYGSGGFTNYEIDSEKRLKTKRSRLSQDDMREFSSDSKKREDIASVFEDEMPKKDEEQKPQKKSWFKTISDKFL